MWILPRVTGPVTSEWLGFCTWIQVFLIELGRTRITLLIQGPKSVSCLVYNGKLERFQLKTCDPLDTVNIVLMQMLI